MMQQRKTTNILNSEEKAWRFSYLKQQLVTSDLEDLFKIYIRRINHACFTLFLMSQCFINLFHFFVVLVINMESDSLDIVVLDLVLYATLALLSVVGTLVSEKFMKSSRWIFRAICTATFLLIYLTDMAVPIYHYLENSENLENSNFRPAYTTHLIIACYTFFTIENNWMALVLGVYVSVSHVLILAFITYVNSTVLYRRIGSDIIYLACINGMGVYFRYMNEIVGRRGFLDRNACVLSNLELKYVKVQQEQLMLSILPKNIIEKVKEEISSKGNKIDKTKPFEDRYLQIHQNVTILYADIVNYTQMTTKLKPVTRLVETLNDLFGSFDDASEELKVLRIKFLGDCYYCVAGLPPENISNHADACVDLGLKMIEIIKKVREQRELEIDMRIGIHTGTIISGIIGISKWQYDIWSKDVCIANTMESTGVPGKVHITKQTRDQLKKSYNIVIANAKDKDKLEKYNISETYLISPKLTESTTENEAADIVPEPIKLKQPLYGRRPSGFPADKRLTDITNLEKKVVDIRLSAPMSGRRYSLNPQLERRMTLLQTPFNTKRRTAFMDNNINRYNERMRDATNKLKDAIDAMPLSKYEQWFKVSNINPLLLLFKNWKEEFRYILQPDPLFKYYLIIEIIVLSCIMLIQNISMPQWEWTTLLEICTILFITVVLLPLTWTHYVFNSRKRKALESFDSDEMDNNDDNNNDDNDGIRYYEDVDFVEEGEAIRKVELPTNAVVKFLYDKSELIRQNALIRTGIYLGLCSVFTVCVFTEMFHCDYKMYIAPRSMADTILKQKILDEEAKCVIPWHMTETCVLVIAMNFLFLRIHLGLKFFFTIATGSIYSILLWYFTDGYYENSETYNYNMQPYVAHILNIAYLIFTFHLLNRQSDYMNRLDHMWNRQLIDEEDEVSNIGETNFNLLKNILPIHVAKHYLNVNRKKEFYFEQYKNVAVMFASVGFGDSMERLGPEKFVKLMDQIICDFDELLISEPFNGKIEKIKLANWTYMAACGLVPGQQREKTEEEEIDSGDESLVVLLEFAVGLLKCLKRINSEALQEFTLRIGICHGEVTAGVVGSKKPLYDIWGDTVNMASRMDSTGVINRIQVTENSAYTLQNKNIDCEYRGMTYVKGKSMVPTYFVTLDANDDIILTPPK